MGRIGDGYGSEYHLKRYIESASSELSDIVKTSIGASDVTWIPCVTPGGDRGEWRDLNFIENERIRSAWDEVWPRTGNPPNWDVIGLATVDGRHHWLLGEAKAHISELESNCTAKEHGGLPQIRAALTNVKSRLGVTPDRDWLSRYYQYANRLAVLAFLTERGIPAKLLFIYFTGNVQPGRECPDSEKGWQSALSAQATHLGLPVAHKLSRDIHKVFVPVLA